MHMNVACRAVGVRPPRWGVPIGLLSAASHVGSLAAAISGRDLRMTPLNIRLMHIMSPMDHSKTVRELRWRPSPTCEAIEKAARFFHNNGRGAASTTTN